MRAFSIFYILVLKVTEYSLIASGTSTVPQIRLPSKQLMSWVVIADDLCLYRMPCLPGNRESYDPEEITISRKKQPKDA